MDGKLPNYWINILFISPVYQIVGKSNQWLILTKNGLFISNIVTFSLVSVKPEKGGQSYGIKNQLFLAHYLMARVPPAPASRA
jgi:hypothetical protein